MSSQTSHQLLSSLVYVQTGIGLVKEWLIAAYLKPLPNQLKLN